MASASTTPYNVAALASVNILVLLCSPPMTMDDDADDGTTSIAFGYATALLCDFIVTAEAIGVRP